MAEKFVTPKGRQTNRKGGSLTGAHGPMSRPMKLWTFESKPNMTLAKLEAAYLAGVEAVDRVARAGECYQREVHARRCQGRCAAICSSSPLKNLSPRR